MSTVIIGCGIIGLSTAYYLSLNPPSPDHKIAIIDSASELFLSASGYAGGFLALDWFDPPVAELGALSFCLHRELAREHDGLRRWGYAGSHVYSLEIDDRGGGGRGRLASGRDWLVEGGSRVEVARVGDWTGDELSGGDGERDGVLNDDGSPKWITKQVDGTLRTIAGMGECAQVEPRELCEFLLEECEKRGVVLKISCTATEVIRGATTKLVGLKVESPNGSETIECGNLVLAAGAWTRRVFKRLFPGSKSSIPIEPLAGYSLVFRSPRYKIPFLSQTTKPLLRGDQELMAYGIFCSPSSRYKFTPEAFARLARGCDPEVWIGGLNDASMKLPETADGTKVMVRKGDLKSLRETAVLLTGLRSESREVNEDDLETIREGLCFRPVSNTELPVIGGVEGENDVWIASGHGPWGISLSLGTGKVMSELVKGEETSVDVGLLGM